MPVHYTGFVVRDGAANGTARGDHVVVSAGGGLVGEPLLRAAAEAQPEAGVPLRLIGGPLLPDAAWERLRALAGPQVELRRTVRGPRRRAARRPRVGEPGRLQHRARGPALGRPGSDRALRDAGGGRAAARARGGSSASAPCACWRPSGSRARTLAAELRRLLAFEPRAASVDLDGARRSGRLLADLVAGAGPAARAGRGMTPAGRMLRPHVAAPLEGARRRRRPPPSR